MNDEQRYQAAKVVMTVADWMKAHGIKRSDRLSEYVQALKTEEYYRRSLQSAVRDFYRSDMDSGEFIDEMIRLIEGQLTRAWNDGMRENGLDPEKDMTPEWEAVLQGEIATEENAVLDFAQAIEDARDPENPTGFQQFYPRTEIWIGRYNDVRSLALITTRPDDRFEWVYGDTDHCSTCEALNGIVATGKDWEASGYRPQDPPNDMLECGGWRCRCHLEPTNKPATEGGIPNV